MIITRTPLRITLGGGGTDLPEFYEKHGGFWIGATIDKYIYVAIKERFEKELRIVYSELELVNGYLSIKHPIIKELFKKFSIWQNIEFVTFADLPGGSGLGSSGAFTVGAIKAINPDWNGNKLAESAYDIERNKLNRSVGKQDQYCAAFGGLRIYTSDRIGNVRSSQLMIPELADKLMLIYTSNIRNSESILSKVKTSEEQLLEIQEIGKLSAISIVDKDWKSLGELMNEHWNIKKTISSDMSTHRINDIYDKCISLGAYGGKLVGAGSGGFIMLVVPNEEVKRKIIVSDVTDKICHVPCRFTYTGSEVLF
jgi:D-glycero-alpha-D-manno-heptose-7-phosphate kinase